MLDSVVPSLLLLAKEVLEGCGWTHSKLNMPSVQIRIPAAISQITAAYTYLRINIIHNSCHSREPNKEKLKMPTKRGCNWFQFQGLKMRFPHLHFQLMGL